MDVALHGFHANGFLIAVPIRKLNGLAFKCVPAIVQKLNLAVGHKGMAAGARIVFVAQQR